MGNPILEGLSLVDPFGQAILACNVACLLVSMGAHVILRSRYAELGRELDARSDPRASDARAPFANPALGRIVREVEQDARRSPEPNVQAIIEGAFQSELRTWLLLERFLRAATGLALILGLLGTFYGLTVAIGRLVHLVAAGGGGPSGDAASALTAGLTQSLSGMAAAFSNSLVGVASAVVLSALGVVNNVTDQRTAAMVRIETWVERRLPRRASAGAGDVSPVVAEFAEAVRSLEGSVARLDGVLDRFGGTLGGLYDLQLVVAVKPPERR